MAIQRFSCTGVGHRSIGYRTDRLAQENLSSSPGRNSTTLKNAEETDVSGALGAVLGAANEGNALLRELVAIWDSISPEI